MKSNAFRRHKYSADLYKFVIKDVGDEPVIEYYFVNSVSLTVVIDDNNRVTVKSEEPFPIGCLLSGIKDADGNLVLDDMIWSVQTLVPVLSPFNTVESYRSRLTKYQGDFNFV